MRVHPLIRVSAAITVATAWTLLGMLIMSLFPEQDLWVIPYIIVGLAIVYLTLPSHWRWWWRGTAAIGGSILVVVGVVITLWVGLATAHIWFAPD